MDAVLVDTGVWIAVFDARDRPHERDRVDRLATQIESMNSIILWPVTYETLKTRFVKNRPALRNFHDVCARRRIRLLPE